MIGNALPPTFSLLVGMAALGMTASQAEHHLRITPRMVKGFCAAKSAPVTPPNKVARMYPAKRKFRSAIPGLRFKTGMRFELGNEFKGEATLWKVKFFYGSSKDIRTIALEGTLYRRILRSKRLSQIAEATA